MNTGAAIKSLNGVTSSQKKLLSKIDDPEQKALQRLQIEEQNKALVATTISNILRTQSEARTNTAANIK